MPLKKYGVVYTPDRLASFTSELLCSEMKAEQCCKGSILDPACGEGALLDAMRSTIKNHAPLFGIDVDTSATEQIKDDFTIYNSDTILPTECQTTTCEFWREKLPPISAIIANPPWSSEKIYTQENLKQAGFNLAVGQYDSYVLFIELSYKLLQNGGFFAFIIPDSIFEAQNENLRKFLLKNTQIKVIARLGEKIFEEVNRATTIIICKKEKPTPNSITKCFRLSTENRRTFLSTNCSLMSFYHAQMHEVSQNRFSSNKYFYFDIDTRAEEESLLQKIKESTIEWNNTFLFGRGVEISKSGSIVCCPTCGMAQGYKSKQFENGSKTCTYCNGTIDVNASTIKNMIHLENAKNRQQIFVGKNIQRYNITGKYFIDGNIPGINYKSTGLYTSPKLLIRKTGLGIYGAIDYTGSMTSQSVYVLKRKDISIPLEYYIALLNSRVVYYYYLKTYGENEWKSHPYFTKKIIYDLPIKQYEASSLDEKIIALARKLSQKYSYANDTALEKLIMQKYQLTLTEQTMVIEEMNQLPNLGAINTMKINGEVNV